MQRLQQHEWHLQVGEEMTDKNLPERSMINMVYRKGIRRDS